MSSYNKLTVTFTIILDRLRVEEHACCPLSFFYYAVYICIVFFKKNCILRITNLNDIVLISYTDFVWNIYYLCYYCCISIYTCKLGVNIFSVNS